MLSLTPSVRILVCLAAVDWYALREPTFPHLVACSSKGGHYHAKTGMARSG
jgi:hypothetical protein